MRSLCPAGCTCTGCRISLKILLIHTDVPFQVFSKVGTVRSCSISKKKNKAGIPYKTAVRKDDSRRTWGFGWGVKVTLACSFGRSSFGLKRCHPHTLTWPTETVPLCLSPGTPSILWRQPCTSGSSEFRFFAVDLGLSPGLGAVHLMGPRC